MKRKLSIDQIEVQSFVTSISKDDEKPLNGGGSELCGTDYSCLRYRSCYGFDCLPSSPAAHCDQTDFPCIKRP